MSRDGATDVPTTEDRPRTPFGEYGIQKAAIEAYLLDEARRTGFPATVLHPGDSLRFVVRGERARHVEVRLRDGDAAPATVFPAGAAETSLVQPRETLPIRPVVGAGGVRVVVTALFSDRARRIGADVDPDTEVVTLAIAKE